MKNIRILPNDVLQTKKSSKIREASPKTSHDLNGFTHSLNSWMIKSKICGLQLAREPNWSTRLLQLTGRWQYDGIMWLELWSVKSNNVEFLNQIATSQSTSYPIVLTRLGGPRSRPNPHLKFVEVLGIEPVTSWSVIRHDDH